jgi:hypothetical protein
VVFLDCHDVFSCLLSPSQYGNLAGGYEPQGTWGPATQTVHGICTSSLPVSTRAPAGQWSLGRARGGVVRTSNEQSASLPHTLHCPLGLFFQNMNSTLKLSPVRGVPFAVGMLALPLVRHRDLREFLSLRLGWGKKVWFLWFLRMSVKFLA